MRFQSRDWAWALVAGCVLLAAAAFIVFVIRPGGFEGQVGWFFALMPGTLVGLALADKLSTLSSTLANLVVWPTLLAINLLWYFGISFVVIKVYRSVTRG